ncbi:GTP cyclohydrolase I FolE2 [archaeon SCG-AAA382B04]|nr:GTP cyclohydrolase I FolE2 [archaeon SCG-AAA382B04]
MKLPDVQADRPDITVDLSRVGVSGLKKHVKLAREQNDPVILISEFDMSINLPSYRKGANLSRNLEAMNTVLERAIDEPVVEIESLCAEVAKEILDRHEYGKKAFVSMESEYAVEREAPVSNQKSQEVIEIFAEAVATEEEVSNKVGARVKGTTTCPCAQEIMAEKIRESLSEKDLSKEEIDDLLDRIPIATHNQRGVGTISIKVPEEYFVPIERLVEIIKDSMSSEIFEILKREDEAHVVEEAFDNPTFVEDVVRSMVSDVVKDFSHLPDKAVVNAKQVNKESIHSHDAFAEVKSCLGDLRQEMSN